jgi:hypothetical protein
MQQPIPVTSFVLAIPLVIPLNTAWRERERERERRQIVVQHDFELLKTGNDKSK